MSDFRSWEELSLLEQYQCQFWDMYKDAHGIRPRGIDTSKWTEQDFREEFEYLGRVIDANFEEEKRQQAEAIVRFEDRVANLMHPNTTRERVISWLMDAEGADGDPEYMCYLCGLPYGYFRKSA